MNLRPFEGCHAFSLPLAIIGLYLILAPVWAPGFAPRLYDDARYFQLAVLALLFLCLVIPNIRLAVTLAWLSLHKYARILLVVLLAGGTLSVAASEAPHMGSIEVALVAQLILLMLVVSAATREGKDRADHVFVIAIFAGAALFVLKFWVTYVLYAFESKVFPWDSPFIVFANVRFFSQYQAYTLLLMILPGLVPGTSRFARGMFFLVAANFWALHWMVGTRAAWLGLLVGFATVLIFMRQGRLAWLRKQTLLIVAGAAIFIAHSHFTDSLSHATPVPGIQSIVDRGQGSINERLDLAHSALGFIRQHPVLGIGPGQFGLGSYATFAAHPHNVPLQLLSEYGVPTGFAGIALILMLMAFAVKTLRAASGSSSVLYGSLVAALAMGLTDSLVSGNLIMPHSQMLFAVLAGWLLGRTLRAPSGLYEAAASFTVPRFAIV
ncbi:MAG: O-antigen ligase family protein, partial [Betaproteobacteria bacterium]